MIWALLHEGQPVVRSKVGPVRQAARIERETAISVRGFVHALTNERIRHVLSEHGNTRTEARRGQIAVMLRDFERVPDIVQRFDSVRAGAPSRANGQPRIVFSKAIGG